MASAYHERSAASRASQFSNAHSNAGLNASGAESGIPKNASFVSSDEALVAPLTAKSRGGDASCARLALEAARALVAVSPGVSPRRADALVEMGVRHVLLESALQDLSQVPGERLAAAPAAALECACRALASAAGKHADALADAPPGTLAGVAAAAAGAGGAAAPEAPAVEPETLARAIRCVEGVFQRVAALRRPALLPPPLLPAKAAEDGEASSVAAASPTPDTRCPAAACASPLFGRLAVDADGGAARVEALAGESQPPPIIRPVELTSVPDSVATVEEASACLLYTSPSPRDGLLSRMPSSA